MANDDYWEERRRNNDINGWLAGLERQKKEQREIERREAQRRAKKEAKKKSGKRGWFW